MLDLASIANAKGLTCVVPMLADNEGILLPERLVAMPRTALIEVVSQRLITSM